MRVRERQVLETIAALLRQRFPGRIEAFYAFGSRVRGTHGAWSDFDLLVIVRDKDPSIEAAVVDLIVDEECKAGLSFTAVVKDVRAFALERGLHTPFYENLAREGVPL